ncbi:MAG: PadR family transcriptional regulator [Lachnospiraceae bacterium]|nr:PadR family transcriptional regulator [Lachnospiraceae bacterium]
MAKDNKMNQVILGLLNHENLTGYEIKKRIDSSLHYFWKGSFGSIYPALVSLEKQGMITKVDNEDNSKRERNVYGITDAGRNYLISWLVDSKTSNSLKYEMLLKLFFGGAVDNAVSVDTITKFENEITEELSVLKVYKENLIKVLNEREHVFYYLTVSFGVETYEAYLRWCIEVKQILLKEDN